MTTIALKISRGNEFRRISINDKCGYQDLKNAVKELFDIPYGFSFSYVDHENDEICLSSEIELKEAFRVSQYDSVIESFSLNLRIVGENYKKASYEKKKEKKEKKKAQTQTEQTEKMVHSAFCDMCNKTIEGTRFNCLECYDYILCSECMADSSSSHAFACISDPIHLQELRQIKQMNQKDEVPDLVECDPIKTKLEEDYDDLPSLVEQVEEEEEEDYDDDEFVDWESSEEEEIEKDLFEVQVEEEAPKEEVHICIEKIEDQSPILTFKHVDVPQSPLVVDVLPVIPSPLAASVSQTQYAEQHRQLVDMGFHDLQKNEVCLVASQGDLIQAVLSLLD